MSSETRWLTLDELAYLSKERVRNQKDPRLPYVGLEHIAQGRPFLLDTAPSGASVSTNCVFEPDDILFGKLRPRLRKSLQVDFSGYCSTDILVLRAREDFCPTFVAKVFQSDKVFEAAVQTSVGTRMPRTSWDDLKKVSVFVPPLPEQCRIAEILDGADEAIRQSERVIAKLREMKKGLLHDLLTRGLDAEGNLRDPEAHPEQFKDSPLGRIPREWEVSKIDDLAVHVGSGATPRGGSKVYLSDGIVFIRSQNVEFDGLVLDDVAHISEEIHRDMARSEIFAHDVLINITGASIGRCCSVPSWLGPANVNQHVCAIRLSDPTAADATYLSSVLASEIGQHQVEILNAGSNREGLNYTQLRSFEIPWPNTKERKRVAAVISAHDARIHAEEAALDKLRQVKRGLMNDLLTGRVRV